MSANERNVATRNNEESRLREVTLDSAARDITRLDGRKSVYYVQGKKDYSAKVYMQIAQEQHIFFKIPDFGKDKDKAWVKVRAWKGDENNPEAVTETIVVQRHEDALRDAIFDAIENGMTMVVGWDEKDGKPIRKKVQPDWEIGGNGFPVLTTPAQMLQLMRVHLKEIMFIERKIATFAKRNAVKELVEGPGSDEEDDQGQETPGTQATPPKQQAEAAKKNPFVSGHKPENDVLALQIDIGKKVMEINHDDKDLAKLFFLDFTNNLQLKGIPRVDSPLKLITLEHLQIARQALSDLAAGQEPEDEADVTHVEPEQTESPPA